MKLIFNFNNNRFVIESHLKRVDGKNNDNGIIVNVYEVDITCGDKKANFIFSDVSLDGKSPEELSEERLLRALMFMSQDISDFISVNKDKNKLIELNEWEKLDKKNKEACINEVKEYYRIYDYLIHDDLLAEQYENLIGSMWMNEVGYENYGLDMKLTKIEWKNIFSYGNDLHAIELDETGCLWQLCGLSGAGKTSIIQLPFLLLYGETINGVKLPGIPNRNNMKDSLLRGYVSNGENRYVITRTFKPHALTVEKNGVMIDLPGIDSKQSYICTEIMNGIPKNIYKNILTLSLNTDISFVDMGAKDKRSIIDFLLDMEVLNYYSEMLKKDNSNVTQSINESQGSINVLERSLFRAKEELTGKEELLNGREKVDVKESDIRAKIKNIEDNYLNGRKNYIMQLNGTIQEIQKQKTGLVSQQSGIRSKLQQYNNQLNLLKQDKCPTCGSSFKTDSFDSIRQSLTDLINKTTVEISAFDESISKLDDDIKVNYATISKINGEIDTLNVKIRELENNILLSERYNTAKLTYDAAKNEVSRLESEKTEEMGKIGTKEHDVYLLGILKNVYGDNGVKRILREKYVPELNREINLSLEKLNIPYRMEFDNNFEAMLYDRGDKVQIETLSVEKQRANIAVLYSLIKIVKNKYPQINIVALDETTSHIDPENGMDSFKFLSDIAEELNLNIFIVTHNEIIDETVFRHRLFIEKKGGFSEITYK